MTQLLTAMGWPRVSTPAQFQRGDHIINQNKIREWCKQQRILFIERPGFQHRKFQNPWDNPGMSEILNEIDMLSEMGKQPDMVVAIKIDRFGDEHVILNVLLPFFDSRQVAMVAIRENVNSLEDPDAFQRAVIEDKANLRDKKRTAVTQDNRIYKLRLNKHHHGRGVARPIFGLHYSVELKEYTELADYIDVVKEIYVQYVYEHMTLTQICTALNLTTIKPLRAVAWTERTVSNILRNEAYSQGTTRAGIKCPVSVPRCTAKRAVMRLDMEKGGRKSSREEPLRKIVWCGDCNVAMKLRRKKYICTECKQIKEEVWILGETIEQTKRELSSMLSEVASKLGIGEWLLKPDELKTRIDIVLCDFQKINADDRNELIRMVKNFIPFELGKRVLVYSDRVAVVGMTVAEIMEELDVRDVDWLGYAYA